MTKVNTYPEMNTRIADLLKMGNNYTDLYAAQYIEELRANSEQLRQILHLILDNMDYTAGNCRLNERVGAVLPRDLIKQAREALLNP